MCRLTSFDYINQLEATLVQIIAERDSALARIQEIEQENEQLKKRLSLYENPHTPSSAKRFSKKKKCSAGTSPPKKRGAPKGHRGATRPTPIPDEVVEVVAPVCEQCGGCHIENLGTAQTSIIEDLPPPQKIKVTKFIKWNVACQDCGHTFVSKHPDCPQTGNFGVYFLVYTTMLKYHLRGVIRKIKDFLSYGHGFEISVKGIHDVLLRVGNVCSQEYEAKIARIRAAPWRYIDETSFKVNGKLWWLWIFRTNDGEVLVVIRKSRGGKVLDEILGPDHPGPHVVDGWGAYRRANILQRCWSHLVREVDSFKNVSQEGKRFSEAVHATYKTLKDFLDKDPPMDERKQQKQIFEKELRDLAERYSAFPELKKPLTYLKNGFGCWYTCLLYPGMGATNNLAEQAIREHVIMRKIIGCFRSENGAANYQYIASLLASWRLMGKNSFEELETLLRRELCLS